MKAEELAASSARWLAKNPDRWDEKVDPRSRMALSYR
jgi:ABC-type proline/glycine betaine transport system substrate-binding protein